MADFKSIQDKWQKKWDDANAFKTVIDRNKKKFYCLEMFPYPSASFLHMGHLRNYSIGDSIARFKRMQGYNVLYPMGYDSFGLPAENAAKKAGIHPREYTEDAIKQIIYYQKRLGLSYDWSRMIATHRPEYYKWNQYFFIKFFEKGLVYRKEAAVNYCEKCVTTLANEEVENGRCWRCETEVIQKQLYQWFFKTTAYSEELLKDIDKLEWSDRIKAMQRNWIGRSEGVMINFTVDGKDFPIFTTRPDTIFGVTFMVIALNHPKLNDYIKGTPYEKAVKEFIDESKKAESLDDKEFLEKSGIFIGKHAVNPFNNEKVPIFAGNFVVADYATGMIMAVPAHDQRDFGFAKKYDILIKIVIQDKHHSLKTEKLHEAYTDDGTLVNSGEFDSLHNDDAIKKISDSAEKKNIGKKTVQYKLRDWLISRQRYWGTPIPMIYCDKCGTIPVSTDDLPLLLPEDVNFSVTGNPILTSKTFLKAKCPKCHGDAARETDTMGGFMDSSWYFLRYCSPDTEDKPFDDSADYWMPVDQYVGGIEHAVGHLIYSRFFTKVLRDIGMLDFDEPFRNLFNQGVVYKEGKRMSKSHGNTVTQEEVENKYGIDTARAYMLFLASPEKDLEWSDQGIEGAYKFLLKIYTLAEEYSGGMITSLSNHKDIFLNNKKNSIISRVTSDIEQFRMNNAIISLMEFVHYINDNKGIVSNDALRSSLETAALLLNPFAPHISEECWAMLGNNRFSSLSRWPDAGEIDSTLESLEENFLGTVKDINNVLGLAKISKPAEIMLIVADEWKYEFFERTKHIVEIDLLRNAGEVIKALMSTELKKHGSEITKIVPRLMMKLPSTVVSRDKEFGFLKQSVAELEKQFSCDVKILLAEESHEAKARQAMPGKPAIIVR